jgi:hypothetical protein
MAFIRYCVTAAVLFCYVNSATAQTIYYPNQSSRLLKATADDMAMLLKKATAGSTTATQAYTTLPSTGIIFVYDSTITDNQSCKVQSNGERIIFSAAQDNGLCFGIYQYLQQLGFRFYQPGSIWEVIPSLSSSALYKTINTVFSTPYKYKSWFISGGHNRWVMDNNSDYGWDIYFGENGHNWALYQRRNGMTGAYHFAGHRGDIMSGDFLNTFKINPCYVANYEGSREANAHSVPDINSPAAMQLWSDAIEKKYTQYRNTIFGNTALYADYYRNFNYNNGSVGIEVPDGAQWGTAAANTGCTGKAYPKPSDQQFTLANFTAQKINSIYPNKRMQLYAYSTHADVPSADVPLNPNLDIQVISTAFQSESSPKGLMNRWYNKTSNVSEYHYFNIPQWGGETPMFYADELKTILQRVKDKKGQGVIWEASPAKFASLPFLLAANNNLKDGTSVDSTLHDFCTTMFAEAGGTMYQLLNWWSSDKTVSIAGFMPDNKYKIPLYLQLLNTAEQQTANAAPVVKERLNEVKAYLHYMVLYYDWFFDQRSNDAKKDKAAAICIYLAKTNKLQLVNSYFIIADITSRYNSADAFYKQYNVTNGTAYQNGALPLLSTSEIENNFKQDIATKSNLVQQYQLDDAAFIKDQFNRNNLSPIKTISVKISYTNGVNYPNRSEFYIDAPAAGKFSIKYTPHFNMPGKGYINFTVEDADKPSAIIKDISMDQNAREETISIDLPAAGRYKLTVLTKYQTSLDLDITTNNNYFYKKGPYLGNKTENYRTNLLSLPGYFYVPKGISKIYFSVNNSNPGGAGFAKAEAISKAFVIKDNNGNTLLPRLVTPNDSALFYLEVPAGGDGTFWQSSKMEQYNLCFANINNVQWYAERKQKAEASSSGKIEPVKMGIYPNPGSGVFTCMQNKISVAAEQIVVSNIQGTTVGSFKNTKEFNISNLAAGMYWYRLIINGEAYKGTLVKL